MISICIPTCNRPHLLLQAVRSCLEQTYRDVEIIITDDSSSDASAQALRDVRDDRIRYLRNRQRLGQAANVNHLFELCSTDRLVLLHDDDLLLPDAVEMLDRCWVANPGLIACYGKQQIINHHGAPLHSMTAGADAACARTADYEGVQASKMHAVLSGQFPPDGFMLSSAVARATRFKPEAETGAECDLDFRIRFQQHPGAFYFVNRYLSQYRMTDRSVASNATDVDYGFEMVRALELPPELEPVRLSFLRMRAPLTVRRYLVFGERRRAWAILREARYWPAGRMSAAQAANGLLFVLPQPLIHALRALKHSARARLRRSKRLYAMLTIARTSTSGTVRTVIGALRTSRCPGRTSDGGPR